VCFAVCVAVCVAVCIPVFDTVCVAVSGGSATEVRAL